MCGAGLHEHGVKYVSWDTNNPCQAPSHVGGGKKIKDPRAAFITQVILTFDLSGSVMSKCNSLHVVLCAHHVFSCKWGEQGSYLLLFTWLPPSSCGEWSKAKHLESLMDERLFCAWMVSTQVCHLLFHSSPIKCVTHSRIVENTVDAFLVSSDPESCCMDRSFHDDATFVLDLFVVMSLCDCALKW